ncbi:hypothetical protein AgCh_012956 [Apium graveolens]
MIWNFFNAAKVYKPSNTTWIFNSHEFLPRIGNDDREKVIKFWVEFYDEAIKKCEITNMNECVPMKNDFIYKQVVFKRLNHHRGMNLSEEELRDIQKFIEESSFEVDEESMYKTVPNIITDMIKKGEQSATLGYSSAKDFLLLSKKLSDEEKESLNVFVDCLDTAVRSQITLLMRRKFHREWTPIVPEQPSAPKAKSSDEAKTRAKTRSRYFSSGTELVEFMQKRDLIEVSHIGNIEDDHIRKKGSDFYIAKHQNVHCKFPVSDLPIRFSLPMVCKPQDWKTFLDFRGRIYRSGILHFHERDLARSLVVFAEDAYGLDNQKDMNLLKSFIEASSFHYKGFTNYSNGLKWFADYISSSLNDNNTLIEKARDAKKPLQLLSCAVALNDVDERPPERGPDIFQYLIYYPITQDASASAYQLMSYFLLDKSLAQNTNLIAPDNDDNIQDLYEYLLEDMKVFIKETYKKDSLILTVGENLTRKIIKNIFMPMIYGKTIMSTAAYLQEALPLDLEGYTKFNMILTLVDKNGKDITYSIYDAIPLTLQDGSAFLPYKDIFRYIYRAVTQVFEKYKGVFIIKIALRIFLTGKNLEKHLSKDEIIKVLDALFEDLSHDYKDDDYKDDDYDYEYKDDGYGKQLILSKVFNDKVRRDVKPPVAKPISNKKRNYNSNISQIISSNSKGVTPFLVADIETILHKDDTGIEVQTSYAVGLLVVLPEKEVDKAVFTKNSIHSSKIGAIRSYMRWLNGLI